MSDAQAIAEGMYHDPVLSYPIAMGVKMLDKDVPGWYREDPPLGVLPINLDSLRLDSVTRCVLGQLFTSFPMGMTALHIDYHSAEKLGFMIPEQANVQSYDRMYEAYTREWTDVIAARRAAGV
jgi:hypothetical protein